MNSVNLPKLRKLLADLYPEVVSIRRIVYDAGIDHSRIDFQATSINIWHAVLREAEKSEKVEALLAIVEQEYPIIGALRKQYRRFWRICVAAALGLIGLIWVEFNWLQPFSQPAPTTTPSPPAQRHCPTTQPCLLLADFNPVGNALADSITGHIRDTLQQPNLITSTDFAIAPSNVITSAFVAQDVVEREGALVLIWGNISAEFEKVIIYFALTDQLGIDEDRTIRPYRIHYFDDLTQQIRCSGPCFTDLNSVSALIDQLSSVIAYTATGMVYYANDQPEEASTAFGQALACAGEDFATTQGNGDAAASVIDTDWVAPPSTGSGSALSTASCPLQQALLQPIDGLDPAELYYYAGKAHSLTGDYRTAIALLRQAAERNPQDPAADIAIATAYQSWLDQDDAPEALDALATATQNVQALNNSLVAQQAPATDLAAVAYELGLIAELQHDWQTASTHYADAIAKFGVDNPDAYVAMVALGRVQRLGDDVEAAEQTLQNATQLDEQVPWAWLELAQLHAGSSAAKTDLANAREVAPNQAYVYLVEAELCGAWADYPACAQAAYDQALAKRPQSGWLYDRVGEFYQPGEPRLDHQSWEQAAGYYQQAVAWRRQNPWTQERLAFALFQSGAYGEAAEHFALGLALSHPDTVTTARICMLGQAQKEAERNEQALKTLELCLNGLEDAGQRSAVEEWLNEIKVRQE